MYYQTKNAIYIINKTDFDYLCTNNIIKIPIYINYL